GLGSHTFAVQATDAANNSDASPATHTWTVTAPPVDTTAPDTTLTATEPNPTTDTTGDFAFTSTEAGSTFACSVDGASFTICTSPFSTAVLGLGSHTFAVKATDAANNTDATPASYTWTVEAPVIQPPPAPDTIAPDTALTATEPSPTSDPTGDFAFTSTEAGSTFSCSVDSAPFSACASPFSTVALSPGSHTFAVRATDAAGNTDASPATYTWTLASSAPTTWLTAQPASIAPSTTALFDFSGSESGRPEAVLSFQCALDDASLAPCVGPVTYSGLSQGVHAFRVVATDELGSVGSSVGTSWRVDSIAPSIRVKAAALFSTATSVGTSYAGLDTNGSGIANYDVRYRTAAYNRGFAPTVTPPSWQHITATSRSFAAVPGSTSCFSSRARDLAGNVSAWAPAVCVVSPLDDRSLLRSSGWSLSTDPVYYRQTATSAVTTARTLTLGSAQARRISLVASTCATCGSVSVYWNGALLRTVSLHGTTVKHRQVIAISDFGIVRTGTVVIKTLSAGTVRIDGLGIARV
ncbi:MAG: putative internalin, partial [Frankiales bacterium]|nr:putative internalin [Frankiales bacterium]